MKVEEYAELIQAFLNSKISIQDFEKEYMQTFLNEPRGMEQNVFLILDKFFADVECYDASINPDTEDDFNITEATLRKKAEETLENLKACLGKSCI